MKTLKLVGLIILILVLSLQVAFAEEVEVPSAEEIAIEEETITEPTVPAIYSLTLNAVIPQGITAEVEISSGELVQSLVLTEGLNTLALPEELYILKFHSNGVSPVSMKILITEDTVKSMQPGSTIVDVAIDQGGNCEITEPGRIVEKHGVNIIGILNIPGTIPTSSTWMFANNIYHYLTNLVEDGIIKLDTTDEIIASSLVTRNGELVHQGALEAMGPA